MAEITDAVNGRDTGSAPSSASSSSSEAASPAAGGKIDMTKKSEDPGKDERPPFDFDAT